MFNNINKKYIIILCIVLIITLIIIIKLNKTIPIYVGYECGGEDAQRLIDYLIKLRYPNKKIIWDNTKDCSFFVKSNFCNQSVLANINNKPYVYWSGESYNMNDNKKNDTNSLTIISSSLTDDDKKNPNIYSIPFACLHFDYKKPQRYYNNPKQFKQRKLLGYCNSNTVEIREILVDMIAEKADDDQVFALGKSIGTSNKIKIKKIDGMHSTDNVINEYSNYKFIIAMENKIADGYITEKIINAFKSGAIPIYWGDPKIAKELFNEKAFVCVNDFETIDDCADYIINLSNDSDKMKKMISEPVFKNNVIPDIFKIGDYNNPPNIYKEMSYKIKTFIDNNNK